MSHSENDFDGDFLPMFEMKIPDDPEELRKYFLRLAYTCHKYLDGFYLRQHKNKKSFRKEITYLLRKTGNERYITKDKSEIKELLKQKDKVIKDNKKRGRKFWKERQKS